MEDLAGLVPDDIRGYYESKDGERVREPGILDDFNLSPEDAEAPDHARPRRRWLDRAGSRRSRKSSARRTRPRRGGEAIEASAESRGSLRRRCSANAERSDARRMSPPIALASAARERRDIVSGEVMDEARLVRFVAGPGRVVVTPDLARKLPGRGLWVAASREAVETAAQEGAVRPRRQGQAHRAAGPGRPGGARCCTARLLAGARPCAQGRRAYLRVREGAGRASAGQGGLADRGQRRRRRRPAQAARPRRAAPPSQPRVLATFSSAELSLALGAPNVIHTAFLAGRGAERWTVDVERLAVSVRSFPESWREEPPTRTGAPVAAGPRPGIF